MNSQLQHILQLIKQAASISDADKAVIEKTIKDTDKSLEIANFKLDRTEKVKRTTAILLEETIQELELKRKAVEEQNQELGIESSLERVRTVAMGMMKPDDLLSICKAQFIELKQLGFTELRNTLIGIFHDDKGHMMDYDYSDFTGGVIHSIPYNQNPIIDRSLKKLKSGAEAFSEFVVQGTELEEWKAFRKKHGEYDDTRIVESTALYYYFYSINQGNIGISTFKKISEQQLAILKRFRNVFDLAYKRYVDISSAELQAREAQIETALERVRSKTMAMHNSADVGETAATMVDELKKLGVETIRCGIGIMHEPGDMEVWTARTNEDGRVDMIIGWLDMHMHPMLEGAFKSWRKKNESYSYDLIGEDLLSYYNAINHYPGYPIRYETDSLPPLIHHNEFYFAEGILFAFSKQQLSDEDRKIFKRFAGVFGQTYRRYLDLQKAEAQAREAQIETSLERVRSRTLAMQKSDELAETAAVLFRQLITLGIAPNRLYIAIIKDENGEAEFWLTDEDGTKVSSAFEANLKVNETFRKMFQGWKEEKKTLVIDMQGEELKEYFQYLISIDVPFKGGLAQTRRVQDIAYFGKGFIGMASPEAQPVETITLLERFAAVFNLTYTRFNDLKLAEAHALQAAEDLEKLHAEKKRTEDALSELQATQKQLVQSEKMASLGELTAGIAHEIQNPLNFVNNFSEVSNELMDEMLEEVAKGNFEEVKLIVDDVKKNLEKINHHGKRADGIVKGMLQHSRTSSGQKEATDINALCDEYLRLSFHGLRAKDKTFNAKFETDFDNSVGKSMVIPQDIGRVILNLINNAFYAVSERKKKDEPGYEPTVKISTWKKGKRVEIQVKDNGTGIPQKVVEKIFQPFFTTKPTGQGTGLGLSLSYDIITKGHGGEIKVETKENEGTIFTLEIPEQL